MYTCCRCTYSVTGHGCENTQKDRVEFLLANMAQVECANLKKERFRHKQHSRKEKGSVGHAKVVQNSTFAENIVRIVLLPPYRKSGGILANTLKNIGGGMESLLMSLSGINMHSNRWHPHLN